MEEFAPPAQRAQITRVGEGREMVPTNLSSRIEQMNKILGTRILVSEYTYRKCGLGGGRALGAQKVRGLDQPIVLVTIGERA